MKKIITLFIVTLFLHSVAFANDIISILSNGKFNDNSQGVKVLNQNEAKNIVGGIVYGVLGYYDNFAIAFAKLEPDKDSTLTINTYNGTLGSYQLDQDNLLGYRVTKIYQTTSQGTVFPIFQYDSVVIKPNGSIIKLGTSVESNFILRTLSSKYKSDFERYLGGLR